jgi:general stress protein 26
MCAYFVDVSALEDVISERVKVTSAWTERFVSWFEEWESKSQHTSWSKRLRTLQGLSNVD